MLCQIVDIFTECSIGRQERYFHRMIHWKTRQIFSFYAVLEDKREIFSLNDVLFAVSEEQEVSIKEAAEAVLEAMEFKGEVIVSF